MSLTYPGGYITKSPPAPTSTSAPGIWTMDQALQYIKAGTWPTPPQPDQYFNYTTLLLPGSGTNGAQNNTFLDSSTNAFSITRNGNTTQGTFSPFSQTGWSVFFDGTSFDYLDIASVSDLTPSGDFTIEFWAYPFSTTGVQEWYSKGYGIQIYIYDGYWGFALSSSNTSTYYLNNASGTATANSWQHIALTRSGNVYRIFINGTLINTTTSASSPSTGTKPLRLGDWSDSTGYGAKGYMSNVRYVNGTAVYTAAFTPPTSPLTAITNTSLLTCQSNRYVDNSSNGYAITPTGNPSVQAFSPFAPSASYSASTNGGSGYLNDGGYLTAASNSAFAMGTGDFCIEGWYYITLLKDYNIYFDFRNGSNAVVPYLYSDNTGYIDYYVNGSSQITSANALKINQWTHIAVIRSGTSTKLFINGKQVGSTYTDTNDYVAGPLYVGRNNGGGTAYAASYYCSNFRVVKGSTGGYGTPGSTITVPTAPFTSNANTSVLLNFTNAGITDATAKNDLETVGNAQISNTVAKWGSTSIYFDGTGDYLYTPSNQNWSLGGDFTIEFWNQRATTGYDYFFSIGDTYTSTGIEIYKGSGGNIYVVSANAAKINGGTAPTYNTWAHYALVRYGSTITLYINGLSVGTWTSATATFSGNLYVGVEYYNGAITGYCNGYIQDLRITKGIARYTANFTPPTAAFPLL